MLEEITIKDLGVIKHATLPFTPGFTVLTGETGAGKTMVLNSLSLLLGKRANPAVIRHGEELASVEGCWNTSKLSNLEQILEVGAVVEDDTLYINRTVKADGKSRAVVGGKSTPASVLGSISENLVSIHGQSDQIQLKNPAVQAETLDRFAGETLKSKLEVYTTHYRRWQELTKTIKDIKTNLAARQREYEDLIAAVEHISAVEPVQGEDDQLRQQIKSLENVEVLQQALQEAMSFLSSDDYESSDMSVNSSGLINTLQNVSEYDPELETALEIANNIQEQVNELNSIISSQLSALDVDAFDQLNNAQNRLAEINTLIRKYGTNLDDVLEFWETADQRAQELDPDSNNLESLEAELTGTEEDLKKTATELTIIRAEAAERLQTAVNEELAGLAMSGSKLNVIVAAKDKYTTSGVDEVSFMMKTPASRTPLPLGKSASGGELSRIMLALSLVLSDPESIPTFLFDEVDAGLGGKTAVEVGKRLAKLAQTTQIIVVSHLPQVAAFADNHLRVVKTQYEDTVSTDVVQLNAEERTQELSRMLSGLEDSETGKTHAEELLRFVAKQKQVKV